MQSRSVILLLVFCLASLTGTFASVQPNDELSASEKAAQGEVREALTKLFPERQPGMSKGERVFFGPDKLYEYMDGGADAFLLYDFRMLLHHDLKLKDVDLTVDIFDMGTPENAFGMYASERSPSYHFISMGAEGYDNEGILNFVQGRFYTKLAGFGNGANAVMEQVAKDISGRIGGKASLPIGLQILPQTKRKTRSEQYVLKDPLGHPFLGPAYLATYDLGGKESTLVLSVARDEADAQNKLKQLSEHFQKTGKCDAAPEFGEGAIRASNSFEGQVLASAKGRYLILIINPADGGEALFSEALHRLE